ncbi:MAG: peptide-methionine (S)-S-oxide reductase MsrA [Pseudomonadota bacterium]
MMGGDARDLIPSDFPNPDEEKPGDETGARAVLAGGCFWCTEAVFKELRGVSQVRSGYVGGAAETANYKAVCSGTTGHAEAIDVAFDPDEISFGQLLRVFFAVAHDPTQLNRQGNDRGTQYRSAIFYANEAQKAVAQAYIEQLEAAGAFSAPIVTTLEPLGEFYEAEAYHQDYAAHNPSQPYIAGISAPKVRKLREHFPDKLKGSEEGR